MTQAKPTTPRAPPMFAAPIDTFLATRGALEAALTDAKPRPSCLTVASPHCRPPLPLGNKNEIP
jgi:hypothetical protein